MWNRTLPSLSITIFILGSIAVFFTGCQAIVPGHFRPAWSVPAEDPGSSEALLPRSSAEAPPGAASHEGREVPQRLPAVDSSGIQQVVYTETTAFGPPEETLSVPADVSVPADSSVPAELIPPGVTEAGPPRTLEELLQIAWGSNPSVAQASAEVRALRGKWLQAGLPPNPTVGYVAGEIGSEGTAGQQGAYVGQTFITAGKLHLDRAVTAQEVSQAEQQLAITQQRVTTDVSTAYYDVLVAARQIAIAGELVSTSDRAVRISQDLLQAQEVSQVALLQTEVQAQDARILLRRANNDSAAAWRRLGSVVGNPELSRVPLAGQLEEAATELVFDELLDGLLRESPEMAAAASELDRARWALRRACVEVKSNINVQASVQHDAPSDDVFAGVQIGFQVPILNRNQGAIQRARAEITAAEENVGRVELALRERLAEAFRQYANASFEVDKYSQEILPKSERTLDLVTRGYRQGEVGYLDQLTAQRTFFQTNLSYIDALREFWRAKLRIDGLLLEGSLQGRESNSM